MSGDSELHYNTYRSLYNYVLPVYNKEINQYKEKAQSVFKKKENKVSLGTELRLQNSFSQMILQQKTKV